MSTDILKCPVCDGRPLDHFTWKGTMVDVCRSCHGIWFDFGEMKQIADSDTLAAIDRAFQGEYAESSVESLEQKACPVDGTPLERHEWGEDSRIVMDYCTLCSGTWLDAGELEGYTQLLKKLEQEPEQLDAILAEVNQERLETREEIREWVDNIDIGYFTPVFRLVGSIQRMLGMH